MTTAIGSTSAEARALAIQNDGKLVALGFTTGEQIMFTNIRYNPDGSLDRRFGSRGKATPVGWGDAHANASPSGLLARLANVGTEADSFTQRICRVSLRTLRAGGNGSGGAARA